MAFDDKKLGTVFPTHPAIPFDHTIEKGMLSAVGGASGIRSRVYMNGDGDKTFLKTRGGHPLLRTEKKTADPEFVFAGTGDIICLPNYTVSDPNPRRVGFGDPFTLDGNGHSTAATDDGDHQHVVFPRPKYNNAIDVWRWPEISAAYDLTTDPLYGMYGVLGRLRPVDEDFADLPPIDVAFSWWGPDTYRVYFRGVEFFSCYESPTIVARVQSVAIARNYVHVAVTLTPPDTGPIYIKIYRFRVRIRTSGAYEVAMSESAAISGIPAAGFNYDVLFRKDAKQLAVRTATASVSYVETDEDAWDTSTFTVSTVSLSSLEYDTYSANTPVNLGGGVWSSINSAEKSSVKAVVWRGITLFAVVQIDYFYVSLSSTYHDDVTTWEDSGELEQTGSVYLVPIISGVPELDAKHVLASGYETVSEYSFPTVENPVHTISISLFEVEIHHWHPTENIFLGRETSQEYSGNYPGSGSPGGATTKIGIVRGGRVAKTFKELEHDYLRTLITQGSAMYSTGRPPLLAQALFPYFIAYNFGGTPTGCIAMWAVYGSDGRIAVLYDDKSRATESGEELNCAVLYSRGVVSDISTLIGESACEPAIDDFFVDGVNWFPTLRWDFGVI